MMKHILWCFCKTEKNLNERLLTCKNELKKQGKGFDSSDRVPAQQAQGPEFKLQY
jgi:hypothetical protein